MATGLDRVRGGIFCSKLLVFSVSLNFCVRQVAPWIRGPHVAGDSLGPHSEIAIAYIEPFAGGAPALQIFDADAAICEILETQADLISREENPAFYDIVKDYGKTIYEDRQGRQGSPL